MILGITGFNASGKSTIASYLEEKKNFIYISANKIFSEECRKRGLSTDRENLRKIANELRGELGNNFFIIKAREFLKSKYGNYENLNIVIESLRNPDEIRELRKEKNFFLLGVNADIKTRYERARERNRDKEVISFEDFKKSEEKELEGKEGTQNLLECYSMKDFEIINNFDEKNLDKKIEILLELISNIKDGKSRFENSYLTIHYFDNKVILRPFKEKYYLNVAEAVAERSTCLNVRFGAVLVKDDHIISTGYVGAPRKVNSSLEKGFCLRRKLNIPSGQRYEICRSVHAEQNAIINAARAGVSILNSTLFFYGEKYTGGRETELVKGYPCFICKKMIINGGIKEFISLNENGIITRYSVEDWQREWSEKDMLDDTEKYQVKYNN